VSDFDPIRALKAREQRRLLRIPGVHGVGIGAKVAGGKRTNELALTVFVVEKKPEEQLQPEHLIPKRIDTVRTDVIAIPRLTFTDFPDGDKERPMLGGTQITAKDSNYAGTVGCFARDAQGRALAITCQHVVAKHFQQVTTQLTMTPANVPPTPVNPYKATLGGVNTPGTIIGVQLESASAKKDWATYVVTTAADTTIAGIRTQVVAAINALASTSVVASAGTTSDGEVIVTTNPGFDTQVRTFTLYGPLGVDPRSKLLAEVTGNTIEFSGRVDGHYGIYVTWSVAGNDPSQGIFVPVETDSTLDSVAGAVASAVRPGSDVQAERTGVSVILHNATLVACQIASDIRVGQATDDFCSDCSLCCNDDFGRVLSADPEVDAAAIHIRSGIEYKDEIKGDPRAGVNGTLLIKGAYTPSDAEVQSGYRVSKRGFVTGITSGRITHEISVMVSEQEAPGVAGPFIRFFEHAHYIEADPGGPFATAGDSGAAVYDSNGNVVGIQFAAGSNVALATPIQQIQDRLAVKVEGAAALGVVHKVTDADGSQALAVSAEALGKALEAQTQISASPAGKQLADAAVRNVQEVQTLVNQNRRVATVWHRNEGPRIAQALLGFFSAREKTLPNAIDDQPLAQCLQNIQRALVRFGSEALAADVTQFAPRLLRMIGMTRGQALDYLETQEVL
jgi:hypothetical protein